MHCPLCRAEETKVIDSRLVADGDQVKRRRQCLMCQERFTTFETAELDMPYIIKRDARREPFNVSNMRAGMLRALEKRPVSADALETAIVQIMLEIRNRGEREIESREVGELVMRELYRLDHVAYVRFASVYRNFRETKDFETFLGEITGPKD